MPTVDRAEPEITALVHKALAASGMSRTRFAREVVVRDERTVRRWLDGGPVPDVVIDKLRTVLAA